MKKEPKVSVIINCLDGEKFVTKCISSVLNQNYNNLEIIFWDNKSNDQTANIIKKIPTKKIKYFQSKKTLPLYKAKNLAIKKAKGEYLAFLDIDDYWEKEKIKYQIDTIIKENSELVYTNHWIKKGKKKFIFSKSNLPSGFIIKDILKNYPISLSTVLMKKSLCLKYRKFSENYNIISDFDLIFKISLKNKISSINKPLATYLIHDSNTSEKSLNLRVKDMEQWIKFNKKILKKYNVFKDCKNIIERNNYLKLKYFIISNKRNIFFNNLHLVKKPFLKFKLYFHFIINTLK